MLPLSPKFTGRPPVSIFSGFEDFGIFRYSHVDASHVHSGRLLLTSTLSGYALPMRAFLHPCWTLLRPGWTLLASRYCALASSRRVWTSALCTTPCACHVVYRASQTAVLREREITQKGSQRPVPQWSGRKQSAANAVGCGRLDAFISGPVPDHTREPAWTEGDVGVRLQLLPAFINPRSTRKPSPPSAVAAGKCTQPMRDANSHHTRARIN